jgi:hypothetical protein
MALYRVKDGKSFYYRRRIYKAGEIVEYEAGDGGHISDNLIPVSDEEAAKENAANTAVPGTPEGDDKIKREEAAALAKDKKASGQTDASGRTVEVPTDWQQRKAAERRELAIKLGAPDDVTTADADAKIKQEVARRPAAGGKQANADVVEIPENWKQQPMDSRRALAMRLGAGEEIGVAEADALIEGELARRAEAKEQTNA